VKIGTQRTKYGCWIREAGWANRARAASYDGWAAEATQREDGTVCLAIAISGREKIAVLKFRHALKQIRTTCSRRRRSRRGAAAGSEVLAEQRRQFAQAIAAISHRAPRSRRRRPGLETTLWFDTVITAIEMRHHRD